MNHALKSHNLSIRISCNTAYEKEISQLSRGVGKKNNKINLMRSILAIKLVKSAHSLEGEFLQNS